MSRTSQYCTVLKNTLLSMNQACSSSLFSLVGGKGMVSGYGGGSWCLGQLQCQLMAVYLACWIWPAPDVALFNGMTSLMVGKW